MSTKIEETIVRECCQSKDLKQYMGTYPKEDNLLNVNAKRLHPRFCIHCGQLWREGTEMGPAGSMEPVMKKVVPQL